MSKIYRIFCVYLNDNNIWLAFYQKNLSKGKYWPVILQYFTSCAANVIFMLKAVENHRQVC